MKNVKWEMKESFVFPASAGTPTGAETVKVTPGFTEQRNEDGVRLTGIYHIAANVLFNDEENQAEISGNSILIDDVDLGDEGGYFEYAVPLTIDLPPEAGNPLDLVVTNTTCEVDGQGSCEIVWNVECSYKESLAEMDHQAVELENEEVMVAVASPIAIRDTASLGDKDEVLSFLTELEDGLSATSFRSNDILVKTES